MSVVFSGSFSGNFVSTGLSQFIPLPSGVDWMWVYNETQSYAAGAANTGAQFYWRLGMTQGRGTLYAKEATIGALVPSQIAVNQGFFLQDTSVLTPGASVALTGITNGNPPVVNTASTAGLVAGSIVRIFSTAGAQQLGGIDFTVGNVMNNTSFTLANMSTIVNANPGAGTYRIIPFNPYFYPSLRYITKISQAANAIVTLSVAGTWTIGQKVRFTVPMVTALAFGMTQIDQLVGTIVAVGQADADGITNTITVDIDTTAFSAFAFPLTISPGFTPAFLVPVGENMAQALLSGSNVIAGATVNNSQRGMLLMPSIIAGAAGPAGLLNNVISWVAGKSFNQ